MRPETLRDHLRESDGGAARAARGFFALLLSGALLSCTTAPGSFTVRFGWAGGTAPAKLPSPLYMYGYIVAPGSAVHIATSGPDLYSSGAALKFANVPNGDGLVLTIELLDSPGGAAQVIAYGESAPFSLAPGKNVEVDVTLQVHTVTAVPSSGGIQVNGLTNGEVSSTTVSLELFADASATGARVSNLPALPATPPGGGTMDVSALTPDPTATPPTGFKAYRVTGWNLDAGLAAPCATGTLCQRSVYVFFTDVNGIQSETSSTTVTLNRQIPGLSTHVTPAPPNAAGLAITVAIAATPSEPLRAAPVPHVYKTSDPTMSAELPAGFLTAVPNTEYTFEHQASSADDNGTYFVTFDLVDEAGNANTWGLDQSVQFIIDTTAPQISSLLVKGGQGPTASLFSQLATYNQVAVSFTTTKPLTTCVVSINQHPMACENTGSSYHCTYQETGQDPEGSYPISVVAFDNAENEASVPNASVSFDYSPPDLVMSSTRVSLLNVGVGQTQTLTLTPSEALLSAPTLVVSGPATVAFMSASGPEYTFSYDVGMGDLTGAYSTAVTMTDLVGNTNPAPVPGPAFMIDTDIPTIKNVIATPDAYSDVTGHDLVTLTFDVPKSVDTTGLVVTLSGRPMMCQPWSASPPNYTCTYQVSQPEDQAGAQTIEIRTTDEADNTASESATVVFDFTPLTLSPSVAPNPANGTSVPILTIASNKPPLNAPQITVTPQGSATGNVVAGASTGSGTVWTSALQGPGAAGSFTLGVAATDDVGHVGVASTTFTIQAVPPVLSHIATNASTYSDVSGFKLLTLSFDSSEVLDTAPASLTVQVAGVAMACGTYQAASPNYTCTHTVTTADPAGTQAITIAAVDSAGNLATGGTSVTFDFTAPVLTLTVAPNPANATSAPVLTVAVSKALPSAPTISISPAGSLTTGAASGGGTSWSYSLRPLSSPLTGSFTITATGIDAVGHQAPGSVNFTINTAPTLISGISTDRLVYSEKDTFDTVTLTFSSSEQLDTAPASLKVTLGPAAMSCGTYQSGSPNYTCTYAVGVAAGGGTKAITITATDLDGNQTVAGTSVTFDFTAPTLTPTISPNPANLAASPALSVASDKPLISAPVVSITPDGTVTGMVSSGAATGGGTSWGFPLQSTGAVGSFTVAVQGMDDVGHSSSGTVTFTTDTLGPTITNVSTNGPIFSEMSSFNVVKVMFDTPKAATVTAVVDGIAMVCGSFQSSSPRYTCSSRALTINDGTGTQIVSLTALDEVKNSSAATIAVVFDFTPLTLTASASPNPANAISLPPILSIEAGKPLVAPPTVNVTPVGSPVGQISIQATPTGGGTAWTVPIQSAASVSGSFTLTATGTDNVGHSKVATTVLKVNNVNPVISNPSLNATRFSGHAPFNNVQLTFNYTDSLDSSASLVSAVLGGFVSPGVPMTMTCGAWQSATPNYTCNYTVTGAELSTNGATLISTLAEAVLPITIQATDSVGNQTSASTSATFDFMPPGLSAAPAIQYIAAPNMFTMGTPAACLNRQNVLTSVTAATTCTDIRAAFTMTEQLSGIPTVTATSGASTLAFSATASPGNVSYVFDANTTTAGSPPDGTYGLQISATDLVGNPASLTAANTVALAAASIALDTTAPAAPNTSAAGPITYTRVPWGSSATSGQSAFSVAGTAGAAGASGTVGANAWIIAYDGPSTTSDLIGRGSIATDGSFASVPLARTDRSVVYLSAADGAGNQSPVVAVHNVSWTASLNGKVAGSTAANPHVVLEDSFATLTPTSAGTPAGQAGYFGVLNPASDIASEPGSYGGLFTGSATPLVTPFVGAPWVEPIPAAPSAREGPAMAYDSARGVTVLFGGSDVDGNPLGDTWEWDGTSWTQATPEVSPVAGALNGMAYDSARGVTVLLDNSNNTWEWSGATWTQRFPVTTPVGGEGFSSTELAYDSARGVTILYDDTGFWEWNGVNWTTLSPATSPSVGRNYAMAYDSAHGVTVFFGGSGSNETWGWNGTTWTLLAPTTAPAPSAREYATMTYDSARGVMVLMGGNSTAGLMADTWEWNGTTWTQRSVAASPSARDMHAMAYDSARGVTVLFGGTGAAALNDTWEWNGAAWIQRSPAITAPPERGYSAMAYDSARGVTVLFGGGYNGSFLGDTWEWNGATWTLLSPASSPAPRWGHAMAYDSARAVTVLFGGQAKNTSGVVIEVNDTWEWNGTTWTPKTANGATGSPTARANAALVYDAAHPSGVGSTVLFGGASGSGSNSYLADTWEWNGTSWAHVSTATSPPARAFHAMAYDTARKETVLFGGVPVGGNDLGDTWEWNGATWTQVQPAASPIQRDSHAMAYDTGRGVTVLSGGNTQNEPLNGDTWEWNGATWTQRFPTTNPVARAGATMAYDSAYGVTVLFGGFGSYAPLSDTWLLPGDVAAQAADLLRFDFSATGESSSTTAVQKIAFAATAGGTGYSQTVPPAVGSAVAGVVLSTWDFSAGSLWRVLTTTAAASTSPAALVSSSSSPWQAAHELFGGPSQTINFAVFPAQTSGSGAAPGQVVLADPELTVQYEHSESGCTLVGSSTTCVCAADETLCGSICSDTACDPQNCGSCGTACANGSWCISGTCKCPATEATCGGVCSDTSVDPLNCGACGNVCGPSQTCKSSACGGPTPVSLTSSFNRTGIVSDGSTITPTGTGWMDLHGNAASGNVLGESELFNGTTMLLGPANAVNVVVAAAQVIPLPAGKFSTLDMLAVGVNGSWPSQALSVTYTDSTVAPFTQSISNWTTPQGYSNETTVITMPYSDVSNGGRGASVSFYGYAFTLDRTRTVKSITLPNNSDIEVLALTLVP